MKSWEHRAVDVQAIDVGDALKHRDKRATLDPSLSDHDWMSMTFKYKRQDMVWVAGAPGGYWTLVQNAIDAWGAAGWELVGCTPPKALYVGDKPDLYYSAYDLLFKREQDHSNY